MPHHNFKGPEHASWRWALQVLGVITFFVLVYLGLAALFGWV